MGSQSKGRGAIVVVASPKGGVGKSTVSWELAQGFARAGASVKLIDGDETATISSMEECRRANHFASVPSAVVESAPDQLEQTTVDAARKYDLVVVDLGARDWDRYRTLPLAADLWLLPTDFSSANALPAAALYKETIWPNRGNHHSGRALPVRVVLSKTPAHPGANAPALARALLWWKATVEGITQLPSTTKHPFHADTGFGVLSAQFRFRQAVWEEAFNLGASVTELPPSMASKSAIEVDAFLSEVNAVLTKSRASK